MESKHLVRKLFLVSKIAPACSSLGEHAAARKLTLRRESQDLQHPRICIEDYRSRFVVLPFHTSLLVAPAVASEESA